MKSHIHLALAMALYSVAALCHGADSGNADLAAPAPVVQSGITYVTGGIGQDEADAMRALAGRYSLRMTFVTRSGKYLSDVDVEVAGQSGAPDLRIHTQGPFLFVALPTGVYRITALAGLASATKVVSVKAPKGVSLQFNMARTGIHAATGHCVSPCGLPPPQ